MLTISVTHKSYWNDAVLPTFYLINRAVHCAWGSNTSHVYFLVVLSTLYPIGCSPARAILMHLILVGTNLNSDEFGVYFLDIHVLRKSISIIHSLHSHFLCVDVMFNELLPFFSVTHTPVDSHEAESLFPMVFFPFVPLVKPCKYMFFGRKQ